jgi:hypothetical protein
VTLQGGLRIAKGSLVRVDISAVKTRGPATASACGRPCSTSPLTAGRRSSARGGEAHVLALDELELAREAEDLCPARAILLRSPGGR